MSITVRTQSELDQALADKAETIYIKATDGVWLYLPTVGTGSSHVVAWGSSHVEARGSSHVEARDSSHVEARGSSHVEARDSSHVVAWGSSHVEARDSSHVEARGSSHVVAWGSSHVEARGSSHVEAWGSSHVEARGSSHVEARDSSHVVAWGSSHVEARDSSHVEARGSSHVVAWGSSHVEARGSSHVEAATKYVAVHLHSQHVQLDGNGTVIDCTEINLDDPQQWCEFHGVEVIDGIAYLFKAVDAAWTTPRGVAYIPGGTPEAEDWNTTRECGNGLHFCDHPIRSLGFLGGRAEDAHFLKVGVRLDEMVTLGDKVKAKRVVVPCVEVDRYGAVVEQVSA